MKELLAKPVVFDGRNLYDPKFSQKEGFVCYGIGRKGQI
jgi:hypothetical protein